MTTKELRDLSLKLEACMTRLDAAIREMQSERETLNHYKQLVSSLHAELKRSDEPGTTPFPLGTPAPLPVPSALNETCGKMREIVRTEFAISSNH